MSCFISPIASFDIGNMDNLIVVLDEVEIASIVNEDLDYIVQNILYMN